MGGRSRSSTASTQTTTNIQDIDTTTLGIEDSEGAIAGGRDVSVTQISTDQGAIEAGQVIALSGLETAQRGIDTGRRVGEASLDFAGEFGTATVKRAFDFGDASLGTVQEGLSSALDFGTEALDFGGTIARQALTQSAQQSADTAKTLGGAIERAASATRSDTSQGLQKIVMVVAIAGVIGIIGFALIKR